MLALIAGLGDLPPALVARLPTRPLICALQGFTPAIVPDVTFRLEHLGTLIARLSSEGVTQICMAGAVRRPEIDPSEIDDLTKPLVPKVMAALGQGDDSALRIIISVFEDAGFSVVAAHEIAPDLLPDAGVLTRIAPADEHLADALAGAVCIAEMGTMDMGQACLIRSGLVIAKEGPDGTDALLGAQGDVHQTHGARGFVDDIADNALSIFDSAADLMVGKAKRGLDLNGAILFKAPKPTQDWRADLPVIGLGTAERAVQVGLSGIVIEAAGVMVLDLPTVIEKLDASGLFLWVRPKGAS